jgi:hypothetical protein
MLAALAALEKEAKTNAKAAWFWRHVEPQRGCAWTILRALMIADAYQDYSDGQFSETWPALCSVAMLTLVEGCLPLPKQFVQ